MKSDKITYLTWEIGYHEAMDQNPDKWYPASVPGAVQMDMIPTLGNPDWQFSDGYKQFLWMEDVYWTYKSEFTRPGLSDDERLFFTSKGIDYQFQIKLNNTLIH